MKSNMKHWALRREEENTVEVCSYSLATQISIDEALERFDAILEKHPSMEESIKSQRSIYIRHYVLNHTIFPLFDTTLHSCRDKIAMLLKSISFKDETSLEEKNYIIRYYAMQAYLYFLAKEVHSQFWGIASRDTDFGFRDQLEGLPEGIPEYKWWKIGLDIYMEQLWIEKKSDFLNPEKLKELFFSFLFQAYEEDVSSKAIEDSDLTNFESFQKPLQTTFIWNSQQPLFLNLLASYGISFVLLYAMVWSVCEELSEQDEYQELTDIDKYTMLKSIKRDFLVEARFWSMLFLDDNQDIDQFASMLWFTEKMGTMPRGKLHFDFDNLSICIDESTYPNNPLASEKVPIRRGCPIVFVAGEGLGGNFLARELDFAIDIHAKVALWIDITSSDN